MRGCHAPRACFRRCLPLSAARQRAVASTRGGNAIRRTVSMRRRTFLSGVASATGAALLHPKSSEAQAAAQEAPYPRPDLTQRALPRRFKYARPVIDAHTHFYAKEFIDLVVKEGPANGAQITGPDRNGDYRIRAMGGGHGAGYYPYEGSTFSKSLSDIDYQLK